MLPNQSETYKYHFLSKIKRNFHDYRSTYEFLIHFFVPCALSALTLYAADALVLVQKISNNFEIHEIVYVLILFISFSLLVLWIVRLFGYGVNINSNTIYFPLHHFHNSVHEARDVLSAIRINYQSSQENETAFPFSDVDDYNNGQFSDLLADMVDRVKNVMDTIHSRYDIVVSVKLVNTKKRVSEHGYIHRTIFNRTAYFERSVRAHNPRHANRGISELQSNAHGNHSFFVINKIRQYNKNAPSNMMYFGGMTDWENRYNNIMIVPIRSNPSSYSNNRLVLDPVKRELKQFIIGYIQIDSKRSIFTEIDREVISAYADLFYLLMSSRFHMQIQFQRGLDIDFSSPEAWDSYIKKWIDDMRQVPR